MDIYAIFLLNILFGVLISILFLISLGILRELKSRLHKTRDLCVIIWPDCNILGFLYFLICNVRDFGLLARNTAVSEERLQARLDSLSQIGFHMTILILVVVRVLRILHVGQQRRRQVWRWEVAVDVLWCFRLERITSHISSTEIK